MILLEQLQKLIRMPPLRFVVILNHERFVGIRRRCRLGTGDNWESDGQEKHKNTRRSNHGILLFDTRLYTNSTSKIKGRQKGAAEDGKRGTTNPETLRRWRP